MISLPRFLDRNLFIMPALLLLAIACVVIVFTQLTAKSTAIDWCARANLVSCKVTEQGEWLLVTTPDGTKHMIYVQNGKVVQVQ